MKLTSINSRYKKKFRKLKDHYDIARMNVNLAKSKYISGQHIIEMGRRMQIFKNDIQQKWKQPLSNFKQYK